VGPADFLRPVTLPDSSLDKKIGKIPYLPLKLDEFPE